MLYHQQFRGMASYVELRAKFKKSTVYDYLYNQNGLDSLQIKWKLLDDVRNRFINRFIAGHKVPDSEVNRINFLVELLYDHDLESRTRLFLNKWFEALPAKDISIYHFDAENCLKLPKDWYKDQVIEIIRQVVKIPQVTAFDVMDNISLTGDTLFGLRRYPCDKKHSKDLIASRKTIPYKSDLNNDWPIISYHKGDVLTNIQNGMKVLYAQLVSEHEMVRKYTEGDLYKYLHSAVSSLDPTEVKTTLLRDLRKLNIYDSALDLNVIGRILALIKLICEPNFKQRIREYLGNFSDIRKPRAFYGAIRVKLNRLVHP